MTYDSRTNPDPDRPPYPADPADPAEPAGSTDDTHVVERETYVERPVAAQPAYAAPPPPPQQPVNVNAPSQPAYSEPVYTEPAGPGPLYWARRIVSLLFGILFVLLGLRIVLLLLMANQQNDIVNFIYNVTEPFVAPFRGIFALDQVSPGGASVFDIAALVALVGWLLIYLLIMAILRLGDRDRTLA
jgi:uncharacterized protein YggT (Ycf19 family)